MKRYHKIDNLLIDYRLGVVGLISGIFECCLFFFQAENFFRETETDELQNYVVNFLHYFSIVLSMKDAIHEGNIYMININLKLMIPLFYTHYTGSKYFVECVDFIMKTESLLEPELALNIRMSSLVNHRGKIGKNTPMDMAKEQQVKEVKKLIIGLGANKTEHSIVQISKAAPVVTKIVDNFDDQIGYKDIKTRHKSRPEQEDLQCLLEHLGEIDLLNQNPERRLSKYKLSVSVYDGLVADRENFEAKILKTADILRRNIPDIAEDEPRETDD